MEKILSQDLPALFRRPAKKPLLLVPFGKELANDVFWAFAKLERRRHYNGIWLPEDNVRIVALWPPSRFRLVHSGIGFLLRRRHAPINGGEVNHSSIVSERSVSEDVTSKQKRFCQAIPSARLTICALPGITRNSRLRASTQIAAASGHCSCCQT